MESENNLTGFLLSRKRKRIHSGFRFQLIKSSIWQILAIRKIKIEGSIPSYSAMYLVKASSSSTTPIAFTWLME